MLGKKPQPEPEPEKKPEAEEKPSKPDRELDEIEQVFVNRLHRLMDAGYPLKYAEKIALRLDIHLPEAERLMAQGCPPKTASEILL